MTVAYWRVGRDSCPYVKGNHAMATSAASHVTPGRRASLGIPVVATALAVLVAVAVSLNLYLLEDGNPLTAPAYAASPLLRFSYDAAYLSALAAGVGLSAVLVAAIFRLSGGTLTAVTAGIALVVALGGFGGLLVRQPLAFLGLFLAYGLALVLGYLLGQRILAGRMRARLGAETATILGACLGVVVALVVNLVALVVHTVALNPVSHPLFMQGLIGETHFSSLLIGMGLELLTFVVCALSVAVAVRRAASSR
jgi:hypothetical protein